MNTIDNKSIIIDGDKSLFLSKSAICRFKKDLRDDNKERLAINNYLSNGWSYKIISITDTELKIELVQDNTKELVPELEDHQRGCFAISSTDKKIELLKKMFTRGMVIVSNLEQINKLTWTFNAEIEVLHHSATIREKYSPVLHIGPIRQSAAIIKIVEVIKNKEIKRLDEETSDKICLRTKDKAIVEFKFVSHQEFVEKGMIFFFREGTTRGVGRVI